MVDTGNYLGYVNWLTAEQKEKMEFISLIPKRIRLL